MLLRTLALSCMLLVLDYDVYSQTVNKSTWMIGGSAGLSVSNNSPGNRTTILFQPDLGYFLTDDLAAGLTFVYNRTSIESTSTEDTALSFLGAGPWVRYYFIENVFAGAGINVGKYFLKFGGAKATTTASGWDTVIGYTKWISPSVAFEPSVFYGRVNTEDEPDEDVIHSNFGLNLGLQVFLGRE